MPPSGHPRRRRERRPGKRCDQARVATQLAEREARLFTPATLAPGRNNRSPRTASGSSLVRGG
eukprot:8576303-Pyramimonas_sp.AAC.1